MQGCCAPVGAPFVGPPRVPPRPTLGRPVASLQRAGSVLDFRADSCVPAALCLAPLGMESGWFSLSTMLCGDV